MLCSSKFIDCIETTAIALWLLWINIVLKVRVLDFVNIVAVGVAVYFIDVIVAILICQITIKIILSLKKKVAIWWWWPSLFNRISWTFKRRNIRRWHFYSFFNILSILLHLKVWGIVSYIFVITLLIFDINSIVIRFILLFLAIYSWIVAANCFLG